MKIGANTPPQFTSYSANGVSAKEKNLGKSIAAPQNAIKQSPTLKMIDNLKERIQAVKESNLTQETKDVMLENLDDEMLALQEQFIKEQSEKLTSQTEKATEKDDKTAKEDLETEHLKEKGFQVVDKSVTEGFADVAYSVEISKAARTQYVKAIGAKNVARREERPASVASRISAAAQRALNMTAAAYKTANSAVKATTDTTIQEDLRKYADKERETAAEAVPYTDANGQASDK